VARLFANLSIEDAWRPWEPTREQPFDRRLAAHLYRRAGFARHLRELDEAVKLGPQEATKRLLAAPSENAALRRRNAKVRRADAGRQQCRAVDRLVAASHAAYAGAASGENHALLARSLCHQAPPRSAMSR